MNKVIFIFSLLVLASCSSSDKSADEKNTIEKRAEIFYNEGTRNLIEKTYTEALANLLKAKELDPKDSKIRTNLAMALYFRNQKEMAINELTEAIRLDKKNTDAHLNIASIYLENKNFKAAKEHLKLAEQDLVYPGLFRVYFNLGVLELKLGDRKSAFAYLQKAVTEKTDFCAGHLKLGQLYTEEMKYTDAKKEFDLSLQGTCINEPAPHFYSAQSLVNLNRFEEAKTKYKYVIEKYPNSEYGKLAENNLRKLNNTEVIEQFSKNNETELNDEVIETPNF